MGGLGPRPWLVPLVACCLLALLTNVIVINVVGMGTLMRTGIEASPRIAEQLGPEKIDQMVRDAETSSVRKYGSYAAALFGTPIFLCLVAGIAFGLLLATGAQTKFGSILAAEAFATYAVLVVTCIGTGIFLLAVKDYAGVDFQNILMLNAGAFLDKQTTAGWVRGLAGGIDLLAFWALFLKVVGYHKISERVSMTQAATVAIGMYLMLVLIKTGWGAMFG
jgi:hypothetical protein